MNHFPARSRPQARVLRAHPAAVQRAIMSKAKYFVAGVLASTAAYVTLVTSLDRRTDRVWVAARQIQDEIPDSKPVAPVSCPRARGRHVVCPRAFLELLPCLPALLVHSLWACSRAITAKIT